ncbi:SipW-dependent-type signal peptide-containing protein [Fournierella sp.]|uniref:SipW-dependent-type signal peptide-containing protein n=1 Tax=Allofournierella sp. TaxID=1940256 RepID=UPI0025C12420|nr:SipW-dependent-type signal peptide-containing protein [Fournierella sp.]
MKNKRLLTGVISLALVAVVGVGATLAYFTDKTETKTNVFTTGKVDIELADYTNGPGEGDTWHGENAGDGVAYGNVMPGDTLSKVVKVTVAEDSSDCYVAIQLIARSDDKPDADLSGVMDSIQDQARANNWAYERKGDILTVYYPTVLSAGDEVTMFETVTVPTTWGNEYADATFYIDVQAAAVQAANLDAPGTASEVTIGELNALFNQR